MPAQTLLISPLTGGPLIRHTIIADSPASLIKSIAARIAEQARRWGISPLAVDYELEAV
jgi:hypothetical protein